MILKKKFRKHDKTMNNLRQKIIKKFHEKHIGHEHVGVSTSYIDSIVDHEDIMCECNTLLRITNKMIKEVRKKEIKLDLSTT